MAQIRKVVRSTNLSTFQQATDRGAADVWSGIADAFKAWNDYIEPVAIQQMKVAGMKEGYDAAGNTRSTYSRGPGSNAPGQPGSPRQPNPFDMGTTAPLPDRNTTSANALMWGMNPDQRASGEWDMGEAQGPQGDMASYVRTGLLNRGLPSHVVEGFLANFQDESAMNPGINEANPIVAGSRGGFGLAQWTGSRRTALENFAAQQGKPVSDPDLQMDFLLHELNGSHAGAFSEIMSTRNASEAAIAVLNRFEIPAESHRQARQARYASGNLGGALNVPANAGSVPTNSPAVWGITAEGRREPLQYSPFAGPAMQAFNAAAQTAFLGEVQNQGQRAILEMSQQFENDPDGFAQASQAYVDQLVADTPDDLKPMIRAEMTDYAERRRISIAASRQSAAETRARNATAARSEALTSEYADALAAGDADEAARVRAELSAVLTARERIPGSTWTPENSDGVYRAAEQQADKIITQRQKEQAAEVKDKLNLIIDAAEEGMRAEDETILMDEELMRLQPDIARQAAAQVQLRDATPGLLTLPPAEVTKLVEDMAAQPVGEDWEIDIRDAAGDLARENAKAWKDDPIERANKVMPPAQKPPEIQWELADGGEAFVQSLQDRARYGRALRNDGYTQNLQFLSNDERGAMSELFAKDIPGEARALAASAIYQGFGRDAGRVFDQLDIDGTTRFAGRMLANGGNPQTTSLIMEGQDLIRTDTVKPPTPTSFSKAMPAEVSEAITFSLRQNGQAVSGAMKDLIPAAQAIYAARFGNGYEDEEGGMLEAINMALGQSQSLNGPVGGVQDVIGFQTMLPATINGEALADALRIGITGGLPQDAGVLSRMSAMWRGVTGANAADIAPTVQRAWVAATASPNRIFPTGSTTSAGRPVYYSNGEFYSEKSITMDGPDGKFVNLPTVGENGIILSDDEAYDRAAAAGWKDFITGSDLPMFNSIEEAEAAARSRSDGLEAPEQPPYMGPMFNGKPIPTSTLDNNLRLLPLGGNAYSMVMTARDGTMIPVEGADGNAFVFDVRKFMEAMP